MTPRLAIVVAAVVGSACSASTRPAPRLDPAPQPDPAPGPELGTLWAPGPKAHTQPRCLTAAIARVLERPAEAPRARVDAWRRLAAGCDFTWRDTALQVDETALRAHYDLAVALLGAGFPHDCMQIAADVVTPGFGQARRLSSDPAILDLATDFDKLDERCRRANEAQLAGFTTKGIALVSGAAVSSYASDQRCPGVRLDGRTYVAHDGPLVDAFCCAIERAAILEHAGTRYVRVTGGVSSVCGGGTAHGEPAAIYKVAGDRLELVADRSIGWN